MSAQIGPIDGDEAGLDRRSELRRAGWPAMTGMPQRLLLVDPAGRIVASEDPGRRTPPAQAPSWRLHLVEPSAPSAAFSLAPVGRPGQDRARLRLAPTPLAGASPQAYEGNPLALLGVADGSAVCLGLVGSDPAPVPGGHWKSLRDVGAALSAADRALALEALALANWHRSHTHCPACGSATEPEGLGWWRRCPVDGTEHYPRTDPAVIATLTDDEGNLLLARQTRWPSGAYSTLAGFVEPGERAEAAVAREIHEEVGLLVTSAAYFDSQPWPFPSSLMLGFHARTPGIRPHPTVDGLEIAEALWISRDELPGLCEAGEVRLPGRLSIAHRLIGSWYGGDLADSWCRW